MNRYAQRPKEMQKVNFPKKLIPEDPLKIPKDNSQTNTHLFYPSTFTFNFRICQKQQ